MEKKFDVIAMGELLIDFTMNGQSEQGNNLFEACPGGAPCNVLAMLNKLGKKTAFLGKVGDDQFGRLLRDTISSAGIDASNLLTDDEVNTTLAFVHTFPDGDREFSFYRNPGADMMLHEEEVEEDFIRQARLFHFGTLSMTHEEVRKATKKALKAAKDNGLLVSFDPNLRFSLWDDLDALKKTVNDFIPYADIVKISDEELEFITGKTDIKDAVPEILGGRTKYVIYTKGADGAEIYTKDGMAEAPGYSIEVRDTTGAGDSFIGAFLFCILRDEVEDLDSVSKDKLYEYLDFSNAYAANTSTKEGALAAMATMDEIEKWIADRK